MELRGAATIGLILGVVAMLYSAVGHGGASVYTAVLALFSVAPETIRPVALGIAKLFEGD